MLIKKGNGEPMANQTSRLMDYNYRASGAYAMRSWFKDPDNRDAAMRATDGKDVLALGTRIWEYSFILKQVLTKPGAKVLDIGIGNGDFSKVLTQLGYQVTGVDTFQDEWAGLKEGLDQSGISLIDGDARDLSMIPDNTYDISLLLSVIEHIPSNTIFCEKRQTWKTKEMLAEENPVKQRVIQEMSRVIKPGGMALITTDTYLDYPAEVNLDWMELIGLHGISHQDVIEKDDLFIVDNPLHKGRIVPVAIMIEKLLKDQA
jgi:SAM-dependent methyltransferase